MNKENKMTEQEYWKEQLKWTKFLVLTVILLAFFASTLGVLNYSKQYTDFGSFLSMLIVLVVWGIFGWYLYHVTRHEK